MQHAWDKYVRCRAVPKAFGEDTGMTCGKDYDVLWTADSSVFIKLRRPLAAWKATWFLTDEQISEGDCKKADAHTVTTLEIPKDAEVHISQRYGEHLHWSKLRATSAKVIHHQLHPFHLLAGQDIQLTSTRSLFSCASFSFNCRDIYTVGKEFKPNDFSREPEDCAEGVHFFAKRQYAEDYRY